MKDPWYKDYFDKKPKVTKDIYDSKNWEEQYYKRGNSSWGSAWSKPNKKSPLYGGENISLRKKIVVQGVISVVILLSVYVIANNDNNFSKSVKSSLASFISANDYQPAITKMVRMGLEAENVDWPILNELRGKETVKDTKENTNKSDSSKGEEVQPDNSMEVNKESNQDQKVSDNKNVSAEIAQYSLPISGKVIKKYGLVEDKELGIKKFHEGIDIEGKVGTNIKSIGKGQVVAIGNNNELGNYILIEFKDDITVLYAQLGKPKVKEGATVIEGQIISTLAASKEGKTNHLHLEIRRNGETINPIDVLGLKENVG